MFPDARVAPVHKDGSFTLVSSGLRDHLADKLYSSARTGADFKKCIQDAFALIRTEQVTMLDSSQRATMFLPLSIVLLGRPAPYLVLNADDSVTRNPDGAFSGGREGARAEGGLGPPSRVGERELGPSEGQTVNAREGSHWRKESREEGKRRICIVAEPPEPMASLSGWRSNFDVLEQLSSGTDGCIMYRGFDKRRGEPVAIKVVDLESCAETIEDLQVLHRAHACPEILAIPLIRACIGPQPPARDNRALAVRVRAADALLR